MLLKIEHTYLFIFLKEQHREIKKQVMLLQVYSSLQKASEFSMIGVPDFIGESWGMTRPSVSTSSSSFHSNSWNWNAHSSSSCRRAATRCGLRRGDWTVLADCLLAGSERLSDGVVFCLLCICSSKYTSLIDARYNPHLKHNCFSIMFWAAGQL